MYVFNKGRKVFINTSINNNVMNIRNEYYKIRFKRRKPRQKLKKLAIYNLSTQNWHMLNKKYKQIWMTQIIVLIEKLF